MHVLITADTVGGVWTYTRELVTGLARRGVRVTLVSFGEIPTPQQAEWLDGLPGVDFRPTGFRLEWMQDCEADLEASAEYLAGVVAEVNPELLHLNQYFYGSLGVDVPRLVVAHSDVVSWWHEVHGEAPQKTPWMRWYREVVARGLEVADAVVAPSRWMLEAIASHHLRPARASVIYNGRSPLLFNPYVSKDDYALCVGRLWDAGKQVRLVVEQQDMPLTTYVAGTDMHPEEPGRAAWRPEAVRSRLQFKGLQSERQLRQLYSRAALYLATSRYEPFGLAPVEAALSRCALVMNDIPTFRELWGSAACYFRSNDPASLRGLVERLHADPVLRVTYGNLAYHRALEAFSTDRMVGRYLELYRALAARSAAA